MSLLAASLIAFHISKRSSIFTEVNYKTFQLDSSNGGHIDEKTIHKAKYSPKRKHLQIYKNHEDAGDAI
jgi:hypothetical protein